MTQALPTAEVADPAASHATPSRTVALASPPPAAPTQISPTPPVRTVAPAVSPPAPMHTVASSPTTSRVVPTTTATVTLSLAALQGTSTPDRQSEAPVRIAVIGDYGIASPEERDVSRLVKSWHPDYVVTVGDNNYPSGSPKTIDSNVGQFYHEFIAPYIGEYGAGAEKNRFFPTLGNHDWKDRGARAYLDYFTLPGNERYYDIALGPVHLFAVDSMPGEPDGIKETSRQAAWLRAGLAAATEPWRLVVMHHPPFSSGPHGSTPMLRWPYAEWGATAVLAGHDHTYERILRDGIVYFVNGLGGNERYAVGEPVEGSQVRYANDYGAMLIEADRQQIAFQFITRAGQRVDSYTITR